MAELSPQERELYRLRTTGFWVSIALGFAVVGLALLLRVPLWSAVLAALAAMLIASRVLPWYREVRRREEGRTPPLFSMMLTQGIIFGTILYVIFVLKQLLASSQ